LLIYYIYNECAGETYKGVEEAE